jgi:hypothetical protein
MKNKMLLMDIVRQISRQKMKHERLSTVLHHIVPVRQRICAVVAILHIRKGACTKDVDFL